MTLLQLESRPLKNGGINPKNYPWKDELIRLLKEKDEVVELNKVLPLDEVVELIKKADKIICVDSFLQHLCWYLEKPAIVLFGQSDPNIFGHRGNNNLLKDRKYLRSKQFWLWEQAERNDEAFLSPQEVIKLI